MRNVFLPLSLILCFLLLFSLPGSGQVYYNQRPEYLKANSQWALFSSNYTNGVGLNFNTTPATTFPLDTIGTYEEGIASVADPVTGALLFYANGNRCWNAANELMLNGDSLIGNTQWMGSWESSGGSGSTTQGVCIVPFIHEPGKYYLFSLCGPTSWITAPPPAPTEFLFYSVIDMSLDGGLGGIVPGQKNIPLGGNIPLSESMIAVPGNNCDIWLMVHDYMNPVFRAYHITADGVDPTPVVSTSGTQMQGSAGMGAYCVGSMAVSPDRKTIGITSSPILFGAIPGTTGALLCQFDPATGTAGSSVQLNQPFMMSYGIAFSPDNSKVYLCEFLDGSFNPAILPCPILQFDISVFDSTAIAGSQATVGQLAGSLSGYFKSYGGKIYLNSFFAADSLFVIQQPNLSGAACNFQAYFSNNPGNLSFGGPALPNDVVYAFPPDTLSARGDTTICLRNNVMDNATLTAPAGYGAYTWDDGSTGATRNINAAGTYWVLCKDDCHSLADSITVTTGANVSLDLGNDTLLCNKAALTLDVSLPGGSYRWQDGSTNSSFRLTDAGQYWVEVTAQSCSVADTIVVSAVDVRQDLGDDIVLCKGEAIKEGLQLEANAPAGALVTWSTGSTAAVLPLNDTGVYWVRVAAASCMGSDTMEVIREVCDCKVGMPNAFTPNGDGQNDILRPVIEQGCAIQNYVFNVYNRYGARIYSGSSPASGWDGSYPNGGLADAGTYMYELVFLGGTRKTKYYRKGDVVLLR